MFAPLERFTNFCRLIYKASVCILQLIVIISYRNKTSCLNWTALFLRTQVLGCQLIVGNFRII